MFAFRLLWENICSFNARKLWANEESEGGEWGLSDNIQLPATGDEAMERLLCCRGKDAYVVLGLRADCQDEDIRRYYKRQAVLVHPDKNHSNGAEEAFKILSRAFDAIGTSEARIKYNLANLHKNPLHKEMEELWQRLREKMYEARNTMHCDCGSKHARVPVESIRASEARYCKKCRVRHPAKHNDIWAETRCGGFWWVYYACLDGVVYDITQWATCPNNRLKHMKANSHAVQYRLISTTGPLTNKSDLASSRHNKKTHQQQEVDELHYLKTDTLGGNAEVGCGCSMPMGCGSGLGNDIWAETRCGGFWWVYYACLDGVVYDITQWATCPNNRLKHMKANSHAVQYRLISTTGPLTNKSDLASSRHNKKTHQQQEVDELHYLKTDTLGGNAEVGCGCSMPMGCGSGLGVGASQQASYRPPDRRTLDGDRPRRAGRRRKLR
ncbi:DnaJ -like protein dnj-5 [Toxocara canis]|uniref:DnaJ-like protein dnj-5 n=1 Tax=Toxocara canis TaxID=6265 RepID=A0A0B2VDJ5_TOXCA|nr:DnaJ -like protein dnj-5 [Toxocara canis]